METNNDTSLHLTTVVNEINNHPCESYNRRFKSLRCMLQHQRQCQGIPVHEEPPLPPPDSINAPPLQAETFYWDGIKGSETVIMLKNCYEKIVYWRRNLFLLPKGSSGKNYLRETTRLLNSWVEKSPLRQCAMTAIHVMPALLLQKPSKSSKSKDHVMALEKRGLPSTVT